MVPLHLMPQPPQLSLSESVLMHSRLVLLPIGQPVSGAGQVAVQPPETQYGAGGAQIWPPEPGQPPQLSGSTEGVTQLPLHSIWPKPHSHVHRARRQQRDCARRSRGTRRTWRNARGALSTPPLHS